MLRILSRRKCGAEFLRKGSDTLIQTNSNPPTSNDMKNLVLILFVAVATLSLGACKHKKKHQVAAPAPAPIYVK